MTAVAGGQVRTRAERPMLIFFYRKSSGRCRRVEAFLAQVLQRRGNHDTFKVYRVDCDAEPELAARFGVEAVPMLAVVEDRRLRRRLEEPRGCREITDFLAPWLR
jgi:thioredoxin-like negative regulator of GroEL